LLSISPYKALISTRLRARKLPAQRIETTIGVAVLNRILELHARNSSVIRRSQRS
jgi:hypothetical protein